MLSATSLRRGLYGVIPALLLSPSLAYADWALNMTEGVTPYSKEVYGLHMAILGVCTVIGILVFGMILVSIIKFRKSQGAVPATWHHSTAAEIIWTAIPILILVVMAFPATKALVMMEDTAHSAMTIKVTGYQWRWGYDYVEDGIEIFAGLDEASNRARQINSGIDPVSVDNYLLETDNHIVIPSGTKVRILTTAADVIHSWWVPDLGWKRDAIPGFVNESWFEVESGKEGVYRGQCAELCGKDHGFMPIVVEVVTPAAYKEWVADMKARQVASAELTQKTWTAAALQTHGRKVYEANCMSCHQADGQGIPGIFPAMAASQTLNGPLADHVNLIIQGKAGTVMTGFGPLLNDADIAALISYSTQTWGDTARVVQPAEVAELRGARRAVVSAN